MGAELESVRPFRYGSKEAQTGKDEKERDKLNEGDWGVEPMNIYKI